MRERIIFKIVVLSDCGCRGFLVAGARTWNDTLVDVNSAPHHFRLLPEND